MSEPKKSSRLGWLGPAIVIVGVIVAALGVWYMVHARPKVGAVIDTIPIENGRSLVVLDEAGGDRNFVELREGDKLLWQAIVPPYGGRPGAPGIAWNHVAVSVRVIRGERAEVFAISMTNGSKLGGFGLAPDHGPVIKQTRGPVTLTDHVNDYEIVSGPGWSQLVAADLSSGEPRWKQELGESAITEGGVAQGVVWIRQDGTMRRFRASDGLPQP